MNSLLMARESTVKSCKGKFANTLDQRLTQDPELTMFDNALFTLSPSITLTASQGILGYIVTAVRPFTPVSRYYDVNLFRSLTLILPLENDRGSSEPVGRLCV